MTPPYIMTFDASSVPISSCAFPVLPFRSRLNDYGMNLSARLITVAGAPSCLTPNGGKQRQVSVALNTSLLQAKGLSPADVVNAIGNQNLILPSGNGQDRAIRIRRGVELESTHRGELNNLPIRLGTNNTPYYIRDRGDGSRRLLPADQYRPAGRPSGSLISVLKNGDASTLDVVKTFAPCFRAFVLQVPESLKIQPLADQSIFVRAPSPGGSGKR